MRIVAVDDAGVILNPMLAEGQVHGGLAQGAAQALFEEVRYDDDGNPLTATFADYSVISAAELPMFERVAMETPTPLNALGAKGIGESGTIGSTPAVHNAVIDALAHLGVRHLDMPVTPEKIWRALTDRRLTHGSAGRRPGDRRASGRWSSVDGAEAAAVVEGHRAVGLLGARCRTATAAWRSPGSGSAGPRRTAWCRSPSPCVGRSVLTSLPALERVQA